jgi:TonB family protein
MRALRSPKLRLTGRGRHGRRADARPQFKLPPLLLVSFDLAIPEAAPLPEYHPDDIALEIGGGVLPVDDVLHLGTGPSTSTGPAGTPYNAYDEVTVEKRAVPAPVNPKPHYPPRMLHRGIESNFNVYFVVDTSGSVDPETVELPRSVQEDFTNAVAEVLYKWHFVPAELGGRRVRQRVLQPFSFLLTGPFGSAGRQ